MRAKIGWGMTALLALFMFGASIVPKLAGMAVATDTMAALGWPVTYTFLIGMIELLGTVLFLIPGTALFGAIVLTGLFGGAIATQLRVENPLFSHILFGGYLGVWMWISLWLRDARVRAML